MAEKEKKAPIDETEVINTEELRVVLKEREEKDYYATPTAEVENILTTLGYDFTN